MVEVKDQNSYINKLLTSTTTTTTTTKHEQVSGQRWRTLAEQAVSSTYITPVGWRGITSHTCPLKVVVVSLLSKLYEFLAPAQT